MCIFISGKNGLRFVGEKSEHCSYVHLILKKFYSCILTGGI